MKLVLDHEGASPLKTVARVGDVRDDHPASWHVSCLDTIPLLANGAHEKASGECVGVVDAFPVKVVIPTFAQLNAPFDIIMGLLKSIEADGTLIVMRQLRNIDMLHTCYLYKVKLRCHSRPPLSELDCFHSIIDQIRPSRRISTDLSLEVRGLVDLSH